MALDLLPSSVIHAVGWTLIDTLWQGALVVFAYGLARRCLTGPRARVLAGHLALLALACLPVLGLWSRLTNEATSPQVWVALGLGSQPSIEQVPIAHMGEGIAWLHLLVLIWSAGVVLHSLGLAHQAWKLRNWCARAEPMAASWQSRFASLRARLGVVREVRLLLSTQVAMPLLVGVWRPVVLLPASLVARLPADQLELVLLHELAHLRRFDPWFNLLQTALDMLLFYHPAVRWLSRRLREDRELCCDEMVVAAGGDRIGYARALLALAEAALPVSPPRIALAASGGELLARVEALVEVPVDRRAPRLRSASPMLLVGVIALACWGIAYERERAFEFVAQAPALLGLAPSPAAPAWTRSIDVVDLAPPRVVLETGPAYPRIDAIVSSEAQADAARVEVVAAPEAPSPRVESTEVLASAAPSALVPRADEEARFGTTTTRAEAADRHAPRRAIMPPYPRAARIEGVQGWVRLAYRVDPAGRVADISVIEAQPPGVFDAVAQRALQRWRFERDAAGTTRQQQFDFVLPHTDAADLRDEAGRCLRRTGSRMCQNVPSVEALVRLGAD